jgi:hypothetical protein
MNHWDYISNKIDQGTSKEKNTRLNIIAQISMHIHKIKIIILKQTKENKK